MVLLIAPTVVSIILKDMQAKLAALSAPQEMQMSFSAVAFIIKPHVDQCPGTASVKEGETIRGYTSCETAVHWQVGHVGPVGPDHVRIWDGLS